MHKTSFRIERVQMLRVFYISLCFTFNIFILKFKLSIRTAQNNLYIKIYTEIKFLFFLNELNYEVHCTITNRNKWGGKPKKNGRPQIISPFQIWGQSHFHVYGVPRKSCIDILEGPRPQAQQNKM